MGPEATWIVLATLSAPTTCRRLGNNILVILRLSLNILICLVMSQGGLAFLVPSKFDAVSIVFKHMNNLLHLLHFSVWVHWICFLWFCSILAKTFLVLCSGTVTLKMHAFYSFHQVLFPLLCKVYLWAQSVRLLHLNEQIHWQPSMVPLKLCASFVLVMELYHPSRK